MTDGAAGAGGQGSSTEGPQLAVLQEALLRAALGASSLPGGQQVRLPDAAFFERQPEYYVLDENLAGPLSSEGLAKPLKVMSHAALAAAAQHGDLAYLRFRPPTVIGNEVQLALEGRMMSRNAQRLLGLSSVQVTFVKEGDQWVVRGQPTYMAS